SLSCVEKIPSRGFEPPLNVPSLGWPDSERTKSGQARHRADPQKLGRTGSPNSPSGQQNIVLRSLKCERFPFGIRGEPSSLELSNSGRLRCPNSEQLRNCG